MTQPAPVPPVPPVAPLPGPVVAGTPTPTAVATGGTTFPLAGVPQNKEELSALRSRRTELSNQLESATSRRNQLASRLRTADGADRAGIEQHVQLLDNRILQIERDIAITGQQLAATPASVLASATVAQSGRVRNDMQRGAVAIGSLFTLVVLAPLALSAARMMWRRATYGPPPRDTESAQRLARLETAVDTIAIEVERVAEGQRFLTRLLAEQPAVPGILGARDGNTEPVPVIPLHESSGSGR